MEHIGIAILGTGALSFLLAATFVLTAPRWGRFTLDVPDAIQKIHARPTPRIGGLGIYLALWVATSLVPPGDVASIVRILLVAGMPAFAIGLLEDVTRRVRPAWRLAATFLSGVVACVISGIALRKIGVPLLDVYLGSTPIAILFTAFCVAGVSNAINIIDGQNGLASGTAVICLVGIAAIAHSAGDIQLALVCALLGAAVTGFWAVNFPWGRLFLGDGGAYFAGFVLAWVAVLLPARNPEVSPWASLLVCAYPIIEVIYSVARRTRHNRPAVSADCAHLHSLMGKKFVRRHLTALSPVLQNSAVSVIMWLFAAAPAMMAVVFHSQAAPLVLTFLACVVAYHLIYRKVANP